MKKSETKNLDWFLRLTAKIVSSYVTNNAIPVGDLSDFIHNVYRSVSKLSSGHQPEDQPPFIQRPAVSPKRSVQPDYLVCLEDGEKFKMLKRHLATHHGMTPDEYRSKWDLPSDYPMTAPSYSERRSVLAKKSGLGTSRAALPHTVDESTSQRQNVKKRTRSD